MKAVLEVTTYGDLIFHEWSKIAIRKSFHLLLHLHLTITLSAKTANQQCITLVKTLPMVHGVVRA